MKTVHKYTLDVETTLTMPKGAQLLYVGEQRGEPHLWAMHETTQPTEERRFRIYGTGHEMKEWPKAYVGSIQTTGLVLHVFEVN